ncbi:conserved hypothetical protein [Nostocoides japonicum T1-X7]|uniref:Uncharacterized protein n=1 Tax=Nostocoides japonicum T1-X7 TaxID=1194083 RepID=A0A077LTU9_9MICO|nr:hypothetical protein [Tetrasphaera japonica]CCH76801.1 conserved hypothetical protein [Tetrasphaera japonica T1-X7]
MDGSDMDDGRGYLELVDLEDHDGGSWDEGWADWDDDRWPHDDLHPGTIGPEPFRGTPDLGEVTYLVLVDDHVVDSFRRPARGSGYEGVAWELGRGRRQPPSPPRVVEVDREPRWSQELAWLARLVGGVEALAELGTDPLPEEWLDLEGVRPCDRDRVRSIAEVVDTVCDALGDAELRTACRRVLVRAAGGTPGLLGLGEADPPAAAALVAGVGRANGIVGSGCPVTQRRVGELAGVANVSSDRASRWVRAAGGMVAMREYGWNPSRRAPDLPVLGSADLLTSGFRRQLVSLRDLANAERDRLVAS